MVARVSPVPLPLKFLKREPVHHAPRHQQPPGRTGAFLTCPVPRPSRAGATRQFASRGPLQGSPVPAEGPGLCHRRRFHTRLLAAPARGGRLNCQSVLRAHGNNAGYSYASAVKLPSDFLSTIATRDLCSLRRHRPTIYRHFHRRAGGPKAHVNYPKKLRCRWSDRAHESRLTIKRA